jgi:hypothetical protein
MYTLKTYEFVVTIDDSISLDTVFKEVEGRLDMNPPNDYECRYSLALLQVYIDHQIKKIKKNYCNEN